VVARTTGVPVNLPKLGPVDRDTAIWVSLIVAGVLLVLAGLVALYR
jgi:hypothetical protein